MESIVILYITHFTIYHLALLSVKTSIEKNPTMARKTFDLAQQMEGNIYPERLYFNLYQ